MRARVLLPALAVAAACGGLSNQPLRVGTVQGTVVGGDPAVASVSVVAAGLSTTPGPDGVFTLADVPAGDAELFVVGTADHAARTAVAVQGGQVTQAGEIHPTKSGQLVLHLRSSSVDPTQASADIDDTPYRARGFDHSGVVHIGPLPDGCYAGSVTHPSGSVSFSFCIGGGADVDVTASLP